MADPIEVNLSTPGDGIDFLLMDSHSTIIDFKYFIQKLENLASVSKSVFLFIDNADPISQT